MEKEVKKEFELDILNLLNEGLSPVAISKKLNMSMPNLSYYLAKLKQKGMIQKIGYGTWKQVKTLPKDTYTKEIRGHAFMWKVKLPKIANWDKRIEVLKCKGIDYKLIGIKQTPRILFKDRKVWLGKENLIIYEKKSFLGINSIDARKQAVWELISLLRSLETKLGIKIRHTSGYLFTPRKEHYSIIKNELAQQLRNNKEKLYCYDMSGTWWFCCDYSFQIDEAEFQLTKDSNGLVQAHKGQRFFNEMKETNWEVTPKFILDCFAKLQTAQVLTQAQLIGYRLENASLSKEIKSHRALIKEYRKENIAWRKNESIKLTKNIKAQKELTKWL